MFNSLAAGLSEVAAGFKRRSVWLALAREDIGDQHRRTTLGPFWLLANYLLFTGAFIVIFDGDGNFTAFVATGLFVWLLISEVMSTSVSLFVREEGFIKGTTLPLFVYAMRLTMQTLIRAGYSGVGWVALLLISGAYPSLGWSYAVIGLLVIAVTIPAVITVFATLGAFFPDLEFIVTNIMRIGIFLTPIFWEETGEGGLRDLLYHLNPFTFFIEIVRVPILTHAFPVRAFIICCVISALAWLAAVVLLGRFRKQIVFAL